MRASTSGEIAALAYAAHVHVAANVVLGTHPAIRCDGPTDRAHAAPHQQHPLVALGHGRQVLLNHDVPVAADGGYHLRQVRGLPATDVEDVPSAESGQRFDDRRTVEFPQERAYPLQRARHQGLRPQLDREPGQVHLGSRARQPIGIVDHDDARLFQAPAKIDRGIEVVAVNRVSFSGVGIVAQEDNIEIVQPDRFANGLRRDERPHVSGNVAYAARTGLDQFSSNVSLLPLPQSLPQGQPVNGQEPDIVTPPERGKSQVGRGVRGPLRPNAVDDEAEPHGREGAGSIAVFSRPFGKVDPMSSDTLRGIGQEGDGDGDAEARNHGDTQAAGPGNDQGTEGEPDRLKDQIPEDVRQEDARKVRSLDSIGKGTRSLDSSVPDATPSLDAKVSTFAATLLGVPAPVVDRTRGTVQGRDVHLPADAQRSAGLRPVARADHHHELAAPVPVEHSEPTQADPVVGTAVARASVSDDGQVDRDSHGPWYDQIPTADEVYDDPRPNILARVAIGAALAAILSIFIFGFVRLRAQNGTTEEAPVSQVTPAEPPSPKERSVAAGTMPSLPPSLPSSLAPAAPISPTPGGAVADVPRPPPTAAPYGGTVDTMTKPPLPKPRSPTTRLPTVAPTARAIASRGEAPDSTGGTHQETASPTAPESRRARPPSGGTTVEPAATLAVRPQVSDTPASPPTVRSAPSDKQKSKPAYDPDSTLPLNLE